MSESLGLVSCTLLASSCFSIILGKSWISYQTVFFQNPFQWTKSVKYFTDLFHWKISEFFRRLRRRFFMLKFKVITILQKYIFWAKKYIILNIYNFVNIWSYIKFLVSKCIYSSRTVDLLHLSMKNKRSWGMYMSQ